MPRTRFRFPGGGEGILVALAAFQVVALGLWPLGRLFLEGFGPGDDGAAFGLIREALDSRAVNRAFWNTLSASAGSVFVSVILGTGLALATVLLDVRGRVLMTFLILSPLLIPSQILALAWIELMGSSSPVLRALGLAPALGAGNPLYSGGGIVLLLGIEHTPLVFLAVRTALLAIPQSLIDAARIVGARRGRILARIVLPLVLPGVLAGGALAFASAVGNFGVPALLGIPGRYTMLTTLIYQRLNGFGPAVLGQVAVLSLMLVALGGGTLLLRAFLASRAVPLERVDEAMLPIELRRSRLPVEVILWLVLIILSILPLIALVATALIPALGVPLTLGSATLDNFHEALSSRAIRRALVNSFSLSLGASVVLAVVALTLGYAAVTRRNRAARLIDQFADAPYVVPGTVLGIAYILVFLPPLPLLGWSIYGTAAILFLAYLARFLPLVLRPVASTLSGLEPALDEAARIVGAGTIRRLIFVIAPMAAPAAMAGAMLIFMTAFNELTVSALLWSSGVETVGVSIFSLQYEGNSTTAAALSVLSIGVVLMLAFALDRLSGRLPLGTLPWRA